MKVFCAMPHYGPVAMEAARGFFLRASQQVEVTHATCCGSLLANTFNSLWGMALAKRAEGFTHFAMLHADIAPAAGWVDTLLAELLRLRADIVSSVIPIKDGRGVTSTAIDNPEDPWRPLRRLTMHEIHRLPETFDAEDAGYPLNRLLINTGCWIADLNRPWVNSVRFTIQDRLIWEDGFWQPQVIPEDWEFSRQVQDLGGLVFATRKVQLHHLGGAWYGNDRPWGAWRVDEKYVSTLGIPG